MITACCGAAAGLSLLAGRATAVAYPLAVLWATRSPSDAGLVGTALLLPQLVVQLPGGALVDRWDRRRIMLVSGLGQAVVAGVVAALLLSGHVWLWALLAAAFVEGTLGVLFQLAERAAVPAVVPPEQIGAAMTGNEARTRGPPSRASHWAADWSRSAPRCRSWRRRPVNWPPWSACSGYAGSFSRNGMTRPGRRSPPRSRPAWSGCGASTSCGP